MFGVAINWFVFSPGVRGWTPAATLESRWGFLFPGVRGWTDGNLSMKAGVGLFPPAYGGGPCRQLWREA